MSRMPQVTAHELVRFLQKQGFAEDRQSGSHLTLWHAGRNLSVAIPVHTGCDVAAAWLCASSKMPGSASRTTSACDE